MIVLLAALVAPAAFWLVYFRYKDRYQPEPLRAVCVGVNGPLEELAKRFGSYGRSISSTCAHGCWADSIPTFRPAWEATLRRGRPRGSSARCTL